jgi:hypothetical protein
LALRLPSCWREDEAPHPPVFIRATAAPRVLGYHGFKDSGPPARENSIVVMAGAPVEAILDRLFAEMSRACVTTPSRVARYSLQGA